MAITREQRFWLKVQVSGPADCWLWTASTNQYGYGVFWDGERLVGAHRYAFVLKYGPVRPGFHVLHRCDRPACCNPAHLFEGDQRSNMQDKQSKGRQSRGTQRTLAKLTESDVESIRKEYGPKGVTQRSLADKYGVHQSIISEVLAGKRWKHVG